MKKTVYILAVVLLLLVFGVSAFMVGSYILEGKEQKEKYDSLSALKDSVKENATAPAETVPEETDPEGTYGAAEIRDEREERFSRLFGSLSEEEKIQLNDLLGKIIGNKEHSPHHRHHRHSEETAE